MQANLVLERQLRVLHPDQRGGGVGRRTWLEHLKPHRPPPVTHFPQQGHTSNSATPCEPMGVNYIQIHNCE